MQAKEYERIIQAALDALGIPGELLARRDLPLHRLAAELVTAESAADGAAHLLIPAAAAAWQQLKTAAANDDVVLEIVSAFRGIEEQSAIIRDKLARDMPLETILRLSAAPGYSEHHTGRAVDVNTPGCVAREEPFETTDAFRWLRDNAGRFGFTLSYPRENRAGFIYEPWHWFFRETAA